MNKHLQRKERDTVITKVKVYLNELYIFIINNPVNDACKKMTVV